MNADIAHYKGLTTCGSIWACPPCAAKIRNRRAEDISTATADWDRQGREVWMATFTAPHDLGMRLKPLLSTIADGFRHVVSGRAWVALKKALGIVGQIRSLEITHGANGWHPHLHVLIYVDGRLDAFGLARLILHLRERWADFITRAGYRVPHEDHGVDVQRCRSAAEAGAYIAKLQDGRSVGNEMTRADMKSGRGKGRTPIEILDDFRWTGDADDLRLWHEYETATKGRQCITWSKGLRALLLPEDPEEKTDEDLAAEEVGGEDIAHIEGETWRAIVRRPGLPAALLDAAERGGLEAMNELLARHHIGAVSPPPVMIRREER
ncbi:protein rep [Actinomadura kijaniata]|uniref:protein rep n=1 Tax=Actinomadura kijaniata TaxID=46161 RepID=UPI000B263C54